MTTSMTEGRAALAKAQHRMIEAARIPIRTRQVTLADGPTLQVLEAGEGEPLLMWHGSGVDVLTMLPLLEQLPDRRVIAPHRPGYGLSEMLSYDRANIRQRSVRVVEQVLDAFAVDKADFVGNSTGGVWSLWTALDRPDRVGRIVLAGVTPLLPGTKPPLPLRLMSTPGLGTVLGKIMPDPSPETVRRMMKTMGEGETIGRHPLLIDALIAAASDPVANQVAHEELTSMLRGVVGFRPEQRFANDELGRIEHDVLMIWGTRDPLDAGNAVARVTSLLPNARAEVLDAGHAPWLGDPAGFARLMTGFLGG